MDNNVDVRDSMDQTCLDGNTRTKEAFFFNETCCTRWRRWVRWRDIKLVYNGDLQKVHLGCNNNHVVRPDLHPVGYAMR